MMSKRAITRRGFLRAMGAGAVAGSTLSILACQPNTSAQSGGGSGGGPEEKALNFYNWSDYVAESTVPDFEKQTGIKVTQDFFSSNEDLLAKLQAGGTGYDVIVPSDYMVAIMIKSDVVQKLDMSQIPNFKNVARSTRGSPTTRTTGTASPTRGARPASSTTRRTSASSPSPGTPYGTPSSRARCPC